MAIVANNNNDGNTKDRNNNTHFKVEIIRGVTKKGYATADES